MTGFASAAQPVDRKSRLAELTESCRKRIPNDKLNPSSSGGIAYFTKRDGFFSSSHIVCLYGSLDNIRIEETLSFLEGFITIDYLILRSTGGDVGTWLSISEILAGKTDTVIVDEICISSCANYAFLASKYKYVPPNSLVVWHGGPLRYEDLDRAFVDIELSEMERAIFRKLADRTIRYYAKLRVNPLLLEDTSHKTFGRVESLILRELKIDKKLRFSGYALDPYVLKHCYNVKGLLRMWYPETYQGLFELGQNRSKELRLLQRPRILDHESCAIEN